MKKATLFNEEVECYTWSKWDTFVYWFTFTLIALSVALLIAEIIGLTDVIIEGV